jgi:hypothetical protein
LTPTLGSFCLFCGKAVDGLPHETSTSPPPLVLVHEPVATADTTAFMAGASLA